MTSGLIKTGKNALVRAAVRLVTALCVYGLVVSLSDYTDKVKDGR